LLFFAFVFKEGPEAEEYEEKLLPELTQFCNYVRRYILELEKQEDDLNWEFVAKELIMMCCIFDLGDEVGRQNLCRLIKDLLISSLTPASFIPHLVAVFTRVERNAQSRIDQVAEIISELKDPMSSRDEEVDLSPEALGVSVSKIAARRLLGVTTIDKSASGNASSLPDEEAVRRLKMEIAGLRVKMNELRDVLDEAIEVQDFIRAQTVKEEMNNLELEQQQLEAELQVEKERGGASGQLPSTCVSVENSVCVNISEAENETVDNPAVTLKCLRLLVATLQDPSIAQLNATLHTLLEEFVIVSVKSEISHIRKEAIFALVCCCLRSIDNSRQHMLLLLQAAHIDVHEVRMAAISGVIDLLMKHGLASFITSSVADPATEVDTSCTSETASNIESALESDMATRGATLTQAELESQGGNSVVAILSKMLDEPDLDLRTEVAEGLCKLLMIGSISSPKLLSRLLLIWYNPMTESESKLRHILGTFFPLYASMSKAHQLALESAFIPTMKILFDAPVTSPLAEIDTEDVGMFFVHLTREDTLQSYKDNAGKKVLTEIESTNTSVHDSLAFAVCNEILSSPDSFQTKVLIKILTSLQLTSNNFVTLRELKVLSEQLLKTVKERSCVRSLERFDKIISDWLAQDPSNKLTSSRTENQQLQQQKRASDGESPDKTLDTSQTPRRRRILFSQSMTGNPLLNVDEAPVPVTVVSDTSMLFMSPRRLPSPVVPMLSDRCGPESSAVKDSSVQRTDEAEEISESRKQADAVPGVTNNSEDIDSSSVEFGDILASTLIDEEGFTTAGTQNPGLNEDQAASAGSDDSSEVEVEKVRPRSSQSKNRKVKEVFSSEPEESGRTSSGDEDSTTPTIPRYMLNINLLLTSLFLYCFFRTYIPSRSKS
jgi:condensin complex subunit 3